MLVLETGFHISLARMGYPSGLGFGCWMRLVAPSVAVPAWQVDELGYGQVKSRTSRLTVGLTESRATGGKVWRIVGSRTAAGRTVSPTKPIGLTNGRICLLTDGRLSKRTDGQPDGSEINRTEKSRGRDMVDEVPDG
ncbi:hypothetical protein BV898_19899 [Hypsibius exemplaris]|uniref:Uncharacterized protein n=1 Tax=Hypsibius exemplaris TaxID=2072580 RepID=A0A9X6NJS4_HYPEX|nr:hypothetical protein BV898_19899 [Hypsibius exemplaris]